MSKPIRRVAGRVIFALMMSVTAAASGWSRCLADSPPHSSSPSPSPATRPANVAPLVVISKEKAGERSSAFLRPPGAGRYELDGDDWGEIPPWRQASFYGIRVRGQFFVYVVDCSGSMIDEDRLERAKDELKRSVFGLRQPQRFQVIFYNDVPIGMPGGLPRSVDHVSKSQFLSWLDLIEPDGGTDPRAALSQALSLRPDAVFLLSDGAFPDGTVEAVAKRNGRKVPIHCIDLGGGLGGDHLQKIARDSGGRYVSRPAFGP